MSYLARILPPEEWPRLVGTEAEHAVPLLHPINTRVLVVEEDGRIVGVWLGIRMVHAECLWIEEKHRRRAPGIVRRLIQGIQRIAEDWAVPNVLTSAFDEDVAHLITKLGGVQMPGTLFALPMQKREVTHGT